MTETSYYEINKLGVYIKQVTSHDIDLWINIMSKIHKDIEYTVEEYFITHHVDHVEVAPPDVSGYGNYKWDGSEWKPVVTQKFDYYEKLNDCLNKRQEAYRNQCDPLKYEIEEDAIRSNSPPNYTEWLEIKDSIRALYPKPVKPKK